MAVFVSCFGQERAAVSPQFAAVGRAQAERKRQVPGKPDAKAFGVTGHLLDAPVCLLQKGGAGRFGGKRNIGLTAGKVQVVLVVMPSVAGKAAASLHVGVSGCSRKAHGSQGSGSADKPAFAAFCDCHGVEVEGLVYVFGSVDIERIACESPLVNLVQRGD